MPDAFFDLPKVMRLHKPVANVPTRIDILAGQSSPKGATSLGHTIPDRWYTSVASLCPWQELKTIRLDEFTSCKRRNLA